MKKDFVCLDIPLFTRILEECREGVESDAELHFLLEQIIQVQLEQKRVLTMDDYAEIMRYKENYAFYSSEFINE